jgi:hypothetical protein
VRVNLDQVPLLRQTPGGGPSEALPPNFLKHADEQTIVGMAAVYQAIQRGRLNGRRFTDWGVVAGPRFLGRATMAVALQRFVLEGAWGVSPHLIPHRSLHSISGTVSQALAIHGPNFGAGGGPDSAAEAMLVAVSLLGQGRVPGVWVVLTELHPELHLEKPAGPSGNGHKTAVECLAVAVALTPQLPGWDAHCLTLGTSAVQLQSNGVPPSARHGNFTLHSFASSLENSRATGIHWRLGCGGWMELKWPG